MHRESTARDLRYIPAPANDTYPPSSKPKPRHDSKPPSSGERLRIRPHATPFYELDTTIASETPPYEQPAAHHRDSLDPHDAAILTRPYEDDEPFGGWTFDPRNQLEPTEEQWDSMSSDDARLISERYGPRIKRRLAPDDLAELLTEASSPPAGWFLDPSDPEYPSNNQSTRMAASEETQVQENIDTYLWKTGARMSESETHIVFVEMIFYAIISFLESKNRGAYVARQARLYYSKSKWVEPDVMVVTNVPMRTEGDWKILEENGRVPDICFEVHYFGSWSKDFIEKRHHYAKMGVKEYFIINARNLRIRAYRLGPNGVYQRIRRSGKRLYAHALNLSIAIVNKLPRFFDGENMLLTHQEKADAEAARADAEATRADNAEAKIKALENEIAELRAWRKATQHHN